MLIGPKKSAASLTTAQFPLENHYLLWGRKYHFEIWLVVQLKGVQCAKAFTNPTSNADIGCEGNDKKFIIFTGKL
jgi:hypothetical protein